MSTSPRRSSRFQFTEIFKNIYGVESAADSPPVVVKFQRHLAETIDFNNGMETGHLKYAPSLRNPYYMCLHVTQFAELLVNTPYGPEWATPARYHRTTAGVAFQSYFNISLKLFRDIANDEVDWLALSCLEDPQVVDLSDEETEAEAVVLKEMAFTGLLDPPIIDPVDRKRYDEPVPGMEVEGEAIKLSKFVRQDPYPSTSIDYEKTIWKISREIAKKKSRRAYIPVRHPQGWLMWLRLRNWNKDRQKRRGQLKNMKEVFKKLWMHLTATDPEGAAGYRPRYSSAELGFPLYFVPAPDLLTLRLGWGAQQRDALFEGLVEAIRKTHPNTELVVTNSTQVTGTGFVKMGENPFGLFATYVSANAFDIYMKGLEALNGYTGQSLSRQDAHRLQLKTDTELESWIGIHYHPKDKEYTTPQDTARESVLKWQTQAESPYSKEKPCGSTWCIGVGSAKIKDAFGKRIAKYSPKEIMGMSANEAAEHAFGWKMLDQAEKHLGHMHKLSNGMYMAEWLHLCAFSWGGLTKSPRKAAFRYRSSDIPENLIIGTSETNSVMTRFEKAWQALVIDESSLMIKGQENTSFNAKLFVTRNDRTKLVIRDEKKNGRYSRTSSPISLEESNIAKRHHFVAYTVSYSIHFSYGCKLLATGSGSSLKTIFYPFLRPFYHSVEDQLDKMLYEEIKARYNRDTVAPGVVPTSASGEIFDGTMVQSLSLYGGKDPYTSKNKTDASEKTIGTRPHNKAGEIRNRRGTTSYRDSGDFETWGKKWKTKSDDLSIPF